MLIESKGKHQMLIEYYFLGILLMVITKAKYTNYANSKSKLN